MDYMDIDGNNRSPCFFKAVMERTLHTMAFPPSMTQHYRGVVTPRKCIVETVEGRKYETTLTKVNNCPTLTDGWRDFILTEDISIANILVFRPTNNFDLEVWVMERNGCERLPHYTFSLEMKPTHVERARLAIPMPFWRSYIEGQYVNCNTAVLQFGDNLYDVEIIHGHGKKLIQNGRAREFLDNNNIGVGDVCTFFLIPHDGVIKFKVKM